MKDINEHLKDSFSNLPLSHKNFVPSAINTNNRGTKRVGMDVDKKYKLQYIDLDGLYKPITSYL